MDTLEFKALEIEAGHNENDILVIYFGNGGMSPEHYLMIQYEEDSEEENPEMNTFHIERDDQSYGGYGGVASASLTRGGLDLELDDKGKAFMKVEGVKIRFELGDDDYKDLEEQVKIVFPKALGD